MSIIGLNGIEFRDLARQILANGYGFRFQASGGSMQPFIQDGDILSVAPVYGKRIRCGDILLVEAGVGRLLAHRVVKIKQNAGSYGYLLRSDIGASPDGWFYEHDILGRIDVVERGEDRIRLSAPMHQFKARVWVVLTPYASKATWLPERFRQRIWGWLLAR